MIARRQPSTGSAGIALVQRARTSRIRFHRMLVLTTVSLVCLASARTISAAAPKVGRPNILLILADDQRADTIAAFGNPIIQTPNLDRLARGGFRFTRAYCMGSTGGAVCVPSRAMLLTGRSLFHIKNDMAGMRTLPEILREAGYATFVTGKWHNRPPALLRSFEQGTAVFFGGMSDHTKVPLVDITPDGSQTCKRIGEKFSSTLFADAAIEFLQSHDGQRPFFAYVPLTASHDPRQAPREYLDMYDPQDMLLPKNYLPQHPFDNGWMVLRDENLAPWPRTERVIRHQLAEYYALITHMDHEIGRILDALKESGAARNTVVIYAADHGLALGSHGLLGKQSLYEHSMKTPFIVSGPGIPKGQSSDAFAYLLDIFPTVCEITGTGLPSEVDGHSLRGIWRGEKQKVRDSLYTAFAKDMRAVRDERWKLIRYPQINKSQLFDLENDPHEMRNLADEPMHAERVAEMMKRLAQWQDRSDDRLPLTSDNPRAAEIDLTGHPREPDRYQPDWIVRKYFQMEGWPEN